MALSGNDTPSHLTSHDLETLVNIQAELERIGGTDMPDAAKEEELATFNLDAEGIATNSALETSTEALQSNSSFRVVNSDLCMNVENVVVESQSSSPTVGTAEIIDDSSSKPDVNNVLEGNISLSKECFANTTLKTLKPIYIVPNRPGTLTTVTASDDNINRLIFTNTTPTVSSTVGSGITKPIIAPKVAVDAKSVMKNQLIGTTSTSKTNVNTPVITKVIFTSNPVTGDSSTQTVSLAPGTSLAAAVASNTLFTGLSQSLKIVTASHAHGINTSGKSVTLTPTTNLSSPVKPQIITTLSGTPTKQTIMVSKIALSPKTPTKITMIPVTVGKSPQKIAPAPVGSNAQFRPKASNLTGLTCTSTNTMTTTAPKHDSIAVSPSSKFIIKQPISQTMTVKQGTIASFGSSSAVNNSGPQIKHISVATSSGVQPIQVPGSKFSYIRLVSSSPSTAPSIASSKPPVLAPVGTTRQIAPATISSNNPSSQSQQIQVSSSPQVKIAVPIAPATSSPLIGQPMVASKHLTGQRILIPASNVTNIAQIRPATGGIAVPTNALAQLPPGTTLFSPSGNIVMVPAQYVTQIQPQVTQPQNTTTTRTSTAVTPSTQQTILPAQSVNQQNSTPVISSSSSSSSSSNSQERVNCVQVSSKHQVNGSTLEPNGVRPRKPCNCTKSQCLKLYCDCFANGEFCHNCNCNNCYNNLEHEEERQKAIKACLERNPQAFHPKIGKGRDGDIERRHNKGCNCKRSGCLKNYCECYEAKIMCSYMCKCIGCKNFAESAEKKTLMHLADAAEVRVQQQTAAKSKLSSQMQDIPSKPLGSSTGERLPSSFITTEVVEATCQCLLAQVEAGQEKGHSDLVVEQLVLQEFGRCLLQIIEYASRTKV